MTKNEKKELEKRNLDYLKDWATDGKLRIFTVYIGSGGTMSRYYKVYVLAPNTQGVITPYNITHLLQTQFRYNADKMTISVIGYGFSATEDILDTIARWTGMEVENVRG